MNQYNYDQHDDLYGWYNGRFDEITCCALSGTGLGAIEWSWRKHIVETLNLKGSKKGKTVDQQKRVISLGWKGPHWEDSSKTRSHSPRNNKLDRSGPLQCTWRNRVRLCLVITLLLLPGKSSEHIDKVALATLAFFLSNLEIRGKLLPCTLITKDPTSYPWGMVPGLTSRLASSTVSSGTSLGLKIKC